MTTPPGAPERAAEWKKWFERLMMLPLTEYAYHKALSDPDGIVGMVAREITDAIAQAVQAAEAQFVEWLDNHGCSCAEGRKYNVPRGQCPHELAEAFVALRAHPAEPTR